MIFSILALSLVLLNTVLNGGADAAKARTFAVDLNNNTFMKDGQPFRYISGSIHYVRVPRLYWEDRLRKMYMAGLDAIQVYVAWNVHEPQPGVYDFTGQQDIEEFLQIANKLGLLVILRVGPYICAEWEFGGFPAWLLKNVDKITLRSSDPAYLQPVDRWLGVFLPKMKPLLYANGGPIITVQVENEYGSYFACDHNYTAHLRDVFRQHLGNDVVLFTTDGNAESYLKCGAIENVFATVDFGPTDDVKGALMPMKQWNKGGPLVNSEYYTGWLDLWGNGHSKTSTETVVKCLKDMLDYGANVNMYMFHGGTNFGYMNGAEFPFQAQPSEYDYDAPLSEAGDTTSKYMAIRELIGKYKKLPAGEIPPNTTKVAYGPIDMSLYSTVLTALPTIGPASPVTSKTVLSMEDVDQAYGFILYRTVLQTTCSVCVLNVTGIRDRGYVAIDGVTVGIVDRLAAMMLNIVGTKGQTLDIIVENQGRINFGAAMNDNKKGIIYPVTLNGEAVVNWQIYPLNLTNLFNNKQLYFQPPVSQFKGPSIFTSNFQLPDQKNFHSDTFLEPTGWFKGQAFVNGFNLGRYWQVKPPQVTLFVPASVLRPYPYQNTLILVELERAPRGCFTADATEPCSVQLRDHSIYT